MWGENPRDSHANTKEKEKKNEVLQGLEQRKDCTRADTHAAVYGGLHAGIGECALKQLQSTGRAAGIRIKFLRFTSQHCLHNLRV